MSTLSHRTPLKDGQLNKKDSLELVSTFLDSFCIFPLAIRWESLYAGCIILVLERAICNKEEGDFLPAVYSLSRHWLLVVLTACPSVGVSYDCHLLFSSCQYQCHLVLYTWPAAATTDDRVDSRRTLGDL